MGGGWRLAAALLLLAAWAAAEAEEGPPEDDYRGPPPSEHEHPRDVPTSPQDYKAPGHWATPPPEAGIQLGFVPQRLYAQVRHSDTVRHLPRSAALAEARTAEEVAAAPRLREVLKSKKVSEVYSEEGYEDSAYDHAGHEKNSEQEEDYERHEDARKKPRRRRPHAHDQYQEGSRRVEAAWAPPGADLEAAPAAVAAIAAPAVRHSALHKASLVMSVEDSDGGRRPNKLVAGYTHLITHPPRPQSAVDGRAPPASQTRRVLEPVRLQVSRRQDGAPVNPNPRVSPASEREQSKQSVPVVASRHPEPSTTPPPDDGDDSGEREASKWEPARNSPLRTSKIPIVVKDTTQETRPEVEAGKRDQRRRRPSGHAQEKNLELKTEVTDPTSTQQPVLVDSKLKVIPKQPKVASGKTSRENQVTNRPNNFRLVIEDRFSEEMTPSEFSKFIADAIGTKAETSNSPPEQTKARVARNHAPEYRPITEPLNAASRSRRDTTLASMDTATSESSDTTEAVETVLQPTSWRVYGPRESDATVVQQASGAENVPQLLGETGSSADSVADPSAWAFPDLAPAQDSTEGFSQQVLPQNFFNQPYWYPRPFTLPASQVAESRVDLHIAEPEQAVGADDQQQEAQQLEETKVPQPVTWPSLDDADEILIFIKTKSRPSNDTSRSDVTTTAPTLQLQVNNTVNSSSLETLETVSSSYVVQNPVLHRQQPSWPSENGTENNNALKSSPYIRGGARENSTYNETTDTVIITDPTPELTSNTTDDRRSFEDVLHQSKTEPPSGQRRSSYETTTISDSLGANDTEANVTTTIAPQREISSTTESDTHETLPTVNSNYDKEPTTTGTQSEEPSSTDADRLLEALQLDSPSFGVRKSSPRSRYPSVQVDKGTDQNGHHEKSAAATTTGAIPQSASNQNDTEVDNVTTESVPEERANETDSDLSVETLRTDSTSYRRWQSTPYAKHPSLPLESSLELSTEQEPVAMETAPRPDTRPSDDDSKGTEAGTGDGITTKSQVRSRGRGTRLRISSRYTAANLTNTSTTAPEMDADEADVTAPTSTEASLRRSLQVIPLKGGRVPQYDVLEQDTTAVVQSTTEATVSTTPDASDLSQMPGTVSSKELLNVKETSNFGEHFSSRGFWGPIQHLVQETAPVVKYLYPKTDSTLPVATTTGTSSVEALPSATETASATANKSQTADVLTESLGKPRIITASTLQYYQVPAVENATTRILMTSAHENSPQQADFTAQLTSAQFSLPHEQTDGNGSHTQNQSQNATEFQGSAYPHSTVAGSISEGQSETQASVERHVSGKDGRYHKVIGRRRASSSFAAGDAEAAASSEWASYLESPLQPQGFSYSDAALAAITSADESETRADEGGEEEPNQEAQDRQDYVDDAEADVDEHNSELEEDSAPANPAPEYNEGNREKRRYLESEEEEQRLEEEEKKLDAEKDREVEEKKKEWVEALREIDHPKIRAPFNSVKYPFYYGVPKGTLSSYSPIRYAMNPHAIPQKTAGGMEFYDSREELVECPEVTPNLKNVVPKRRRPGEWNKSPMPKNLPRLRGLGDKIDCLKVKYWGEEPLDSPLFKEEEIGKQVGASSSQVESLREDDSTGFYGEILGNIRNIQALGNMKFSLQGSDSSSSPSIDAVKYQNRVPPSSPPNEIVTSDGKKPPVPAETLTPPKPVPVDGRYHSPQAPKVVLNTNEKPQPLPARILYAQQKNVPLHFTDTSSVRPASGLLLQKSPNVGPVTFLPAQFQGYAAVVPQLGYVGISPPPLPPTQTPAQTQLLVEQLLAQVPSRARSEEVIGLRPPPLPEATPFVASPTLPRIIGAIPQSGLLMAAAPFEDSMASDSRPLGEKDPMEASASDTVAAVVSVHGEDVPAQESSQTETEWVDQQAISSQLVEQSRRVVYHEETAMSPMEDDQGQTAPRSARRKESRAHRTTMETSQKLYRHYGEDGEVQDVPRRGRGHRRRQRVRSQENEASESTEHVERPRNRRPKGKGHRGGRRNNLIQTSAEPRGREYTETAIPTEATEGHRGGRRNNVIQSSAEPQGREYTQTSTAVETPEGPRGGRRNNVIQSSAEPRGREYTETSTPIEAPEGHREGRRNNLIQGSAEPRGREYTEAITPTEVPEVHLGGRRNNLIQSSPEPRRRESTEPSPSVEAPEGHRGGRRNNLIQSSAEPRGKQYTESTLSGENPEGPRGSRRNNLLQISAEPQGRDYTQATTTIATPEGPRGGRRNNAIQSSAELQAKEYTHATTPVDTPEGPRGGRRNNLIHSSAEPRRRESTEASPPVNAPEGHRGGRRNNLIQSSAEPRGRQYTDSTIPGETPEGPRGGRRNNLIQSSAEPRRRDSTETSIPVEDPTAVNHRGRAAQRQPTSWSYDKRRGEPRYEDAKADIYSKTVVVEAERRNSNSPGTVSGHVPTLNNENQKVVISADETASSEAPLATFHVAYNTGTTWGKQENRRAKNRDDTVVDRDVNSATRVKDDSRENDISTPYYSGTAPRNVPRTNTVEKLKDLGLWLSPSQINNVISSFISNHKTLLDSTSELPDQSNYITEALIESTTVEPQKLTSPRRNTERNLVGAPRAKTEDTAQVTTESVKPLRVTSGRKSSVVAEVVTSTVAPVDIPQTTTEFVKTLRLTSVRKSNVVPELVTSTVTPPDYYSTKRRKRPKYKKMLPFSAAEYSKVRSFTEKAPAANHAGQRYYTTTSSPQYASERPQVVSESYPAVTPVRPRNRLPTNILKRKYEILSNDNTHETTTETIGGAKDRLQVTRWQKQESMRVGGNHDYSTESTVETKQSLPETRANKGNSLRAREKIGSDARRYQYTLHGNDAGQPVPSAQPAVWTGDKQTPEAVPTDKVVRNKYRQLIDQRRRQNEYETADSVRKDRPAQRPQFPAGVVGQATADGEAAPRRVQWRPRPHWHRLPAPKNQATTPEEPATEATHQTRGQRGRPRLANDLQRQTYDPTTKTYGATTTVAPPPTTEPSRRIKAVEHRRVTKEEIFTRTYIPDDNLADELVEQSERDIVIEPYRRHAEEDDDDEEEDIFEPFESLHFESDYVMYPENHLSENDDVDSRDDYDDEYDAYDEYDEEDASNTDNSGTKDTSGDSDTSNDRERDEVSKENTESSTTTPSLTPKLEHTLTTQRPREFTRRVGKVLESETDSEEFSSRDATGNTKSVQSPGESKSENIRPQISAQAGKEEETPTGIRYPTRARTSDDQTTTEQTTATTASAEKSRENSARLNQQRYPSRRPPVNESATNAPDLSRKKKVSYHALSGDGQRRKDSGYETSTNAAEDNREAEVEELTTTEAPRRQVYTPTIPPYRQSTTRRTERRQGNGGSMISYTVDTETGVGLWLPEGAERIMERRPKASRLPWKDRPKKNENKEASGEGRSEDGTGAAIRNRLRSNLRRQNGADDATDMQTKELKVEGGEKSKLRKDVEAQGERTDRSGRLRNEQPVGGPSSNVDSISTVEGASDENSTLPEGFRGKPGGDQLYKAYMASLHDDSATSDVTESSPTAEDILSEHQVFILGKILSALPPRQRAGIVRGMVTGLNGDPLHSVFEKDRVRRSHHYADEAEGTPAERTASRSTERREGT